MLKYNYVLREVCEGQRMRVSRNTVHVMVIRKWWYDVYSMLSVWKMEVGRQTTIDVGSCVAGYLPEIQEPVL